MQATPATWYLLLSAGWTGRPDLKILCGGEALPRVLAERLIETGAHLWNLYGPTETTIWSSVYEVGKGGQAQTRTMVSGHENTGGSLRSTPATRPPGTPIGTPIANTQLYISDEGMQTNSGTMRSCALPRKQAMKPRLPERHPPGAIGKTKG